MAFVSLELEGSLWQFILLPGAQAIGSHLADLLVDGGQVLIADDLSNGRAEFLEKAMSSNALTLIKTDIATEIGWGPIYRAVERTGPLQCIWHLAANSDIPAGINDASIDFRRTPDHISSPRICKKGRVS